MLIEDPEWIVDKETSTITLSIPPTEDDIVNPGITIQQLKAWELKEWQKNDLRNKENIQSLRRAIQKYKEK